MVKDVVAEEVRQFVDGALLGGRGGDEFGGWTRGGSEGVGIDGRSSNTLKTELSSKLGRSNRGS